MQGRAVNDRVKYWEVVADNLKKAGWSLGYVSAIDLERRTIWIADAHHGDGRRFVVGADDQLTLPPDSKRKKTRMHETSASSGVLVSTST
jgi:hypothetical protein